MVYFYRMFDFRLKVFRTVARRLNFTRAAEELFITQPAITKHIQEIEKHFQMQLFQRNGTRITLTPAGHTLLKYADEIFELYRHLEIDLHALNREHSGLLRIGASTTVAQYVLPPVMADFHQRFKEVSIRLQAGNTEEIEKALLSKEIDLGIIEGHSKTATIAYTPFIQDEIVLVTRAGSPMASREISLTELLQIPLLVREPGSGTQEVIHHALKKLGVNPASLTVEMELNSTESIKLYLLNSDCMAFVSLHALLKELKAGECSIVDVKGLHIERYFYMIRLQGASDSLSDLFSNFALRYNLR